MKGMSSGPSKKRGEKMGSNGIIDVSIIYIYMYIYLYIIIQVRWDNNWIPYDNMG